MTTYFVSTKNAQTPDQARESVETTLWDYHLMIVDVKAVRSWFRHIGWNVSFVVLGV